MNAQKLRAMIAIRRNAALTLLLFCTTFAETTISSVSAATETDAAHTQDAQSLERPFDKFKGWWSGTGRIGLKGKPADPVKCRATYFVSIDGSKLEQNLRCATQSFNMDVKSKLTHKDGKITGTWHENKYEVGGEVTGKVEKSGITLFIKTEDIGAVMHVIARDDRQIVEINFNGIDDVLGVTMLFKKGTSRQTQ